MRIITDHHESVTEKIHEITNNLDCSEQELLDAYNSARERLIKGETNLPEVIEEEFSELLSDGLKFDELLVPAIQANSLTGISAVLRNTCTLVEIHLRNYLDILEGNGDNDNGHSEFRKIENGIDSVKQLTGTSLKEHMVDVGFQEFYDTWKDVRCIRNKITHQGEQATVKDMERAYDLADQSFEVFKKLINKEI